MSRAAFAFSLVLLAACARSEDASTLPSDMNGLAVPVEQVRPAQGEDNQLAIGEWRESLQDEARALEFGPAGAAPLFSLRCDSRRGVVLQRHGVPLTDDLPIMLVTLGNDTRRLAVTGGGGPVPMLRAALNARDPLLSTLAQEGSPITVRVGDSPPLILPPSAMISEFVSLCSTGGGQQGGDEAATNATSEEDAPETENESGAR